MTAGTGERPSPGRVTGVIEVTISEEASRIINEAGGLILEIRERCRVIAPGARDEQDDLGAGQDDPLIGYLRDHPLARAAGSDATASTLMQCDALDHFGVPRGTKAIAIWMYRRWTREIADVHGPARSAATLRRWRNTNLRWGET